ncbi:MAG: COQ9 family protein [Actinomycetota bacterium]
MDIGALRDALVVAMLPHVTFDGWSEGAMAEAAHDLGLDPTMPARVFPGGPAEAVELFVDYADRTMAADLAALLADNPGMRMGDRVFNAVKLRLERWQAEREPVRRALALLALPHNLPLAARLTWRTADAIWAACGDRSHDFSWYTRRSTLAAVYAATVLYWLDDGSEGAADTWAFLKRRLGDVQKLPKLTGRFSGVAEKLARRFPGR